MDPHTAPATPATTPRIPGLPTPEEDAIVRDYTRALADLREAQKKVQAAYGAKHRDNRRISAANSRVERVQKELQAIEDDALRRESGELLEHLSPLTAERERLRETPGLLTTTAGTRVPCLAASAMPREVRGMDFSELERRLGRPPDQVDAAVRPTPGEKPRGHERLTWVYSDHSRIVVDRPRQLGGRPVSGDLPHAEIHGPNDERLDVQGIEVPDESIAAHMTIVDLHRRMEAHFAPERAK